MQIVVVAGGAGFIGSHLGELLLEKNYKVLAIDNFITGSKKNIDPFLSHPHFTFLEHDIIHPLPEKLPVEGEIAAVFHLASPASPNKNSPDSYINHPIETLLVNSVGTKHLLDLSQKNNSSFLYVSSSEVYGDPQVIPQPETYFGNVNPNGVRSVYDEGKRFGEAITMAYVRSHQMNGRIIRIFNTYGPRMQPDDGRVVSNFIVQSLQKKPLTIYGEGKQTRSFCYVEDLVLGLYKAMFTKNTSGEVFNLGNPDERTIEELATIIKEMTGTSSQIVKEELPEDDPKSRRPDISKAKEKLGWEPQITLEQGLQKTIEYFQTIV